MKIGIDVGGTFTDFLLIDHEKSEIYKVLSTPVDPSIGLINGLNKINLQTLECTPFAPSNIPNETSIRCISSIDDNNYAIASSKEVFQINKTTGQICEVDFQQDVSATTLFAHQKIVWIGTEEGIFFYNSFDLPAEGTESVIFFIIVFM